MKPLSTNKLQEFLQRFDYFRNGEFRSLEVLSPIQMSALFAVQDSARGFDWLTIELEFAGVSDALLLGENKLSLVNMEDGISLFFDDNTFYFALGEYNTPQSIKNSNCYVVAQSVKYKEGSF
jgi:hypothetical protein